MKKKLSTLALFLFIPSLQAANKTQFLDAKKSKIFVERYCKNIDEANQFIDKLNQLALSNQAKLKVGSVATYQHLNRQTSKAGELQREEDYKETWTVTKLSDEIATILIESHPYGQRHQEIDLKKGIFDRKVSLDDPMSCLFWSSFAEKTAEGKSRIDGKDVATLYRSQSKLGNTVPETSYGYNVPFNVVNYKETSYFSESTLVKEKILLNFQY